jgi:hypothetical protein
MNFYAYIYRHPHTGEAFYVGKGTGERAYSHLKRKDESYMSAAKKGKPGVPRSPETRAKISAARSKS